MAATTKVYVLGVFAVLACFNCTPVSPVQRGLFKTKNELSKNNVKSYFGLWKNPGFKDPTCSCVCGESNDESRIVGGTVTDAHQFPWMARLSYFRRFYCGGMLINDRYVLTAAHCVKGFIWFMIQVTFGEHDRCNKSEMPETRFVIRAISGDFSFTNFDHDIALLRLNDRVPISFKIKPICLPLDTASLYAGVNATVAGWGTLSESGKPACELQKVDVPVMTNEECRNMNYSPRMISDTMLCAGYPDGMKDSCQGDSGGPLIASRVDKRYELIGIVSWGNGCARPGYPGVYTRITSYLDWIQEHSQDGCFCTNAQKTKRKGRLY